MHNLPEITHNTNGNTRYKIEYNTHETGKFPRFTHSSKENTLKWYQTHEQYISCIGFHTIVGKNESTHTKLKKRFKRGNQETSISSKLG